MSSKANTSSKVPAKIFFGWPTVTISTSVAATLFGYATYYATDVLGLSAATIGLLFMISKIFDGFTDVAAGYLIEKTKSKLGKGRPWQFAIIGYWVSLVLLFSTPQMGIAASYVYIFVMYSLVNSVFMTLLSCSDAVYLSNALDNSDQSVSIMAFGGFIGLVFTMASSMILPNFVASMGTTRQGWFLISVCMAVPFTLLGLVRVLLVKEKKSDSKAETLDLKEMLRLLANNKYIVILAIIIFISNIGSASYSTIQTYYYAWIIGDISIASIMSLSMLAIIIVVILMPVLSKKFGFLNVIRTTTLIGMVGYLIRLISPRNIGLQFAANVISMMGFYTMFAFVTTFVIDCIDYGEWKNGTRTGGTISCAQSVTSKLGTAVGAGMIGVLMGISGYNGTAAAQTSAANTMIIALYSVVPAGFCLLQYILLRIYDIDKILPQIREDLAKRNTEGSSSEVTE